MVGPLKDNDDIVITTAKEMEDAPHVYFSLELSLKTLCEIDVWRFKPLLL